MIKSYIKITLVFLIVLGFSSANAEKTLDLNGEWDVTFNCSMSGIYKEIIKITQKADEFVGIRISGDKRLFSEGEEEIRGKVKGTNISEIEIDTKIGWVDGDDVKVSEGGNKIVIHSVHQYDMGTLDTTLLRKKQ
jgi:hypothetical protein